MDGSAVAGVAAAAGVAGALVGRLTWRRGATPVAPPSAVPAARPGVDANVADALPVAFVVLGDGDEVVLANGRARRLRVVRDRELGSPLLAELVHRARRGEPVDRVELSEGERVWRATAVSVEAGRVAMAVEDRTELHRLEEVRRDFVANVGHELKTPVGALALLAEATRDAADDPEAVRRFAGRMVHESARLTRLVKDVIDLSRLQGVDLAARRERVELDRVVAEAVDRTRELANAKGIAMQPGGERGVVVLGDERQLVTATANLLHNAVAYSPPGTRIAVTVLQAAGEAELAVSDQGIGIPRAEQDRIFERFYRVDPARSRDTGGTGLGLAIVKHVATGHRGRVTVWSREGEGSTFTLHLPLPMPLPVAVTAQPGPSERTPLP